MLSTAILLLETGLLGCEDLRSPIKVAEPRDSFLLTASLDIH